MQILSISPYKALVPTHFSTFHICTSFQAPRNQPRLTREKENLRTTANWKSRKKKSVCYWLYGKKEFQLPERDRCLLSDNGNIFLPGGSAPKLSSLFPAVKYIDVTSFSLPARVFFKLSFVKSAKLKYCFRHLPWFLLPFHIICNR